MSHSIKKTSVVAFYDHVEGVKLTVGKLKKYGFDTKKLSIAGKGYHSRASLFMITGLGPIAVSGPLVAAIIRAFEQGDYIRSLRAFHAGLYNIGIPKESVFEYVSMLKTGLCLVSGRGSVDKMAEFKRVLALSKAIAIKVHDQQKEKTTNKSPGSITIKF